MRHFQEINKTVFHNGLTLITEKLDHFFTVAVGFWIKSGTINERIEQNGIAHFIEHMNFKGTLKRNSEEISFFIESKGGQLNAFTSQEVTCYYARAMPEYLHEAVELLSDIVFQSTFPEDELEKEKKVVFDEIRDVEDNPSEWAADLFYEELFKGHPLAYPILGTEKSIQGLTRNDLKNFISEHYDPSNIIISAAGPVDHDMIKSMLEETLELPNKKKRKEIEIFHKDSYTSSVCCKKKRSSQIHTVVGLPMPEAAHRDKWPLTVLNTYLGAGMSSLLFMEIREKLGIAYSIYSFLDFYQTGGAWGIYWASEKKNYPKVMDEIKKIFRDTIMKKLNEEQLLSAKNQIKGSLYMSMESVINRMNRLSKNEMYYKRVKSVDEVIDAIDSVSLDDMNEILNRYFINQKMTSVVIGDVEPSLVQPVVL